jgi:VIT1/CCC1 family predicted Fe2+/Mn2+ transporter
MSDPEAVPDWQRVHHDRVDPHRRAGLLSDIILGAQDGVVNVLGVVLGVAAAGAASKLVLAAGTATALAESISMAAVAYTSTLAEADSYRGERAREYRHLKAVPALERAEIRELYERKGFRGELLDRIVSTITADPDVWVAVMMSEEHRLAPVGRGHALRSAVVVGLSAIVGSLLPVAPYVVSHGVAANGIAMAVAAGALFALGAYKAKLTVGGAWRSGLELAAIGMASALAGWAVGALFAVS